MSETFTEDQIDAGRRLFGGPSRFLLGVAKLEQLPASKGVEIAFAGRSNVGKSYGYAKAPKHEVKAWQSVLRGYLRGRPGLTRAFVLIDSRHGILKADEETFDLLDEAAVTYQVVLTKTDKIKPPELEKVREAVAAAIKKHPAAFPQIHATSSDKGHGIPELRAEIAGLL